MNFKSSLIVRALLIFNSCLNTPAVEAVIFRELQKKSFQWGFSPDVIFMVHYQSEISDALHLPLFILCCYFFLFSWSTQQVKTDSYKLNPSKSPLCVCYHKVFTFEQSAGEGKRSKIAWWILRTKMIRNKLHRW